MRSLLGTPSRTLVNGTRTWDENAILAANDWNDQHAGFQFQVDVGGAFNSPCGPRGGGHACVNTGPAGDNPIFYTSDFCGQGFGDMLELTNNCYSPNSGAMINAPVFVNANVLWNAYDGNIRTDGNGNVVYDIRRVILHELGHVLGLDHPDDHGQNIVAIMNSHVSNLDRLQDDDIAGLMAQYPGGSNGQHSDPPPTSGCQLEPRPHASSVALSVVPLLFLLFSRRARSVRCRPR